MLNFRQEHSCSMRIFAQTGKLADMKHRTIEYLKHVLEKMDWSMNRLANETNLSASTINRPLREPDWPHGLSPDTVGKIHSATGVDPTPFIPTNMKEPGAMFLGEPHDPMPESNARRVLRNLDKEAAGESANQVNKVHVSMDGNLALISATINKNGIALLRKKIDALEMMLDDTE